MEGREEEAGLVADTNIQISALLKDQSINARLIKSGYFSVYFPEYGIKEIDGYRAYIDAKRKRSSQSVALEYAQSFLLKAIQVVPLDLYRPRVNYHALKGMACIYAKSRDTFGWLTCSLPRLDIPA